MSSILLSADKAEELGLRPQRLATLFHSPAALTADQRDSLEDVQYEQGFEASADSSGLSRQPLDTTGATSITFGYPEGGPSPFQLELLLTAVALVFSLFVIGVSLALAAAESKDERDVLTIAGAPPGILARSAGARAWLLAVLGAAMAVPVGFLPVVVFSWAKDRQVYDADGFPIVFPTRTVLLLLVAVPLVVALVSWLTSATAQRLRPVRVSTASFDESICVPQQPLGGAAGTQISSSRGLDAVDEGAVGGELAAGGADLGTRRRPSSDRAGRSSPRRWRPRPRRHRCSGCSSPR